MGPPNHVREHEEGSLTGDSEGKMNFLGMGCTRFCGCVSPFGNLGRGSSYRELREIVGGGLRKWSISLYRSFVRGTWRCKQGSGDGHLFPCGPRWET